MNDRRQEAWEARLRAIGRSLDYPATPDLWPAVAARLEQRRVRKPRFSRRWAPALVAFLLLLGLGVAAVPSARAALLRVLQIGVIRVLAEPTSTPGRETSMPAPVPSTALSASPTPGEIRIPAALEEVAGETSLDRVRSSLGAAVRLPAYPADLGDPDRVYLQGESESFALLIWFDPEQAGRIRLALHILGPDAFGAKSAPLVVEETQVNDSPALWMVGPHLLLLRSGGYELRTLVEGNVILWQVGEITYRLESALPLGEARRIAESLR